MVRGRDQRTHRAIEKANARLQELYPQWSEAKRAREFIQLLTGNLANDDTTISRLISFLGDRIPVVPAQRWTAGMTQLSTNTQEALVYSSQVGGGAVSKLIRSYDDGTVAGDGEAVRCASARL